MPSLRVYWNRYGDAWAEFFAVDLDDPHFDGLEGVLVVWRGGVAPAAIAVGHGVLRETLSALRADPAMESYRGETLLASWAKVERIARPGVARYLIENLRPRIAPPPPDATAVEVNLPGRGENAPPDVATPPRQIYEDLLKPDGTVDADPAVAAEKKAAAARAAAEAKAAAAARAEAEARADAEARAAAAAKAEEDARAAAAKAEADAKAAAIAKAEAAKRAEEARLKAEAERAAADAAARAAAVAKLPLQKAFLDLVAKAKDVPKAAGFFGGANAKPGPDDERLIGDVVHLLLRAALKMRASDIHLEPQESHLRVRYRIDGILEEVLQVPNAQNLRVVSNVRVSCGLDPEKLSGGKPEDGRTSVKIDGSQADLRLSTFPTPFGDKAVLRVIPRKSKSIALDELGLDAPSVAVMRGLLARPQGLVIVTGPTGSGKTTTLYASLNELNDTTRNIVTLEDPIELKIPGVNQGLIQPKQGFGFSEGLRSILRQDPNVIMVGEIRDQETAEIAMSAALTGHLLLTTLHTVSALGAVNRLLDMGLQPFLVASAVTAVTAQRLARTVCPSCVQPLAPTPEQMAEVETRARLAGVKVPDGLVRGLRGGAGCEDCRGTGYRGRLLVFETVVNAPALREVILRKGGIDDLRTAAVRCGMEPLILDGLRKAAEGRTTLSEILRVIDATD
jgi:type II secretory ATPase GspE/PulE/Tfp pilus assembly ATPase PilB-like protein